MANTTTRVASTTTPWGDDKIRRRPVDTAAVYYPGQMIAVNASGRGTVCDDTSGLVFDGLNCLTTRLQIFTGDDTAGQDKQLLVERPWRIGMKIASATASDVGRAVYALYDDEVAFSTSNSILVGWVDRVVTSTFVDIKPAYAPLTNLAVSSNTLTFAGATTANTIVMPDNLADALSVKEGSNSYLTFVTTNSGEKVQVKKTLEFPGTTGTNILNLVDNLADSLSVKESTNNYLTFVTTNSAERIVADKNLYQRGGNAPLAKLTAATITTAGAGTYTAANLLGGLILRDPAGAGRTDTTHTAAQIVAALPGAAVDDTFELMIVNTADAAEAITLAGGTGVTLVPATITIAQNEVFIGRVRLTNVTGSSEAVTIYGGNVAG